MAHLSKPVEPRREHKYVGIGEGYLSQVSAGVQGLSSGLSSRSQIVPYTSSGVRDVLGENVLECLSNIQGMIEDAKQLAFGSGWRPICDGYDEELYQIAYREYLSALAAYNRSLNESTSETDNS